MQKLSESPRIDDALFHNSECVGEISWVETLPKTIGIAKSGYSAFGGHTRPSKNGDAA